MTGSEESAQLHPFGYTLKDLTDLWKNLKSFHVSITGVQDVIDARIDILEAANFLNTGQLIALDVALDPIEAQAAERTHFVGEGERVDGDTAVCAPGRVIYNRSLAYVEINFSDVRRKAIGGSYLFYPRCVILFWASGYIFASSITLLDGNISPVTGTVLVGSSIQLPNMEWFVSTVEPLAGSPSMFGDVIFTERYDAIKMSSFSASPGQAITFTGVTFFPVTEVIFPDNKPAQFTIANDRLSLVATVPPGCVPGYILIRNNDVEYYPRQVFRPL